MAAPETGAEVLPATEPETPAPTPAPARRRRRRKAAEPAVDVREMTLKDIISGMKRRRGAKPMPSTVQRAAERRKRRRALAAGLPDPGVETAVDSAQSAAPATPPPEEEPDKEEEEEDSGVVAPQVTLDEDGNIVIDQASLVVSAGTVTNAEADRGDVTTIENHAYSNHITSATYAKRESPHKWAAVETERFYAALRNFGTDFSLMESIFPKRSRRQLKLKFKREEREHPDRIDSALNGKPGPLPRMAKPQAPQVIEGQNTHVGGKIVGEQDGDAEAGGGGAEDAMDVDGGAGAGKSDGSGDASGDDNDDGNIDGDGNGDCEGGGGGNEAEIEDEVHGEDMDIDEGRSGDKDDARENANEAIDKDSDIEKGAEVNKQREEGIRASDADDGCEVDADASGDKTGAEAEVNNSRHGEADVRESEGDRKDDVIGEREENNVGLPQGGKNGGQGEKNGGQGEANGVQGEKNDGQGQNNGGQAKNNDGQGQNNGGQAENNDRQGQNNKEQEQNNGGQGEKNKGQGGKNGEQGEKNVLQGKKNCVEVTMVMQCGEGNGSAANHLDKTSSKGKVVNGHASVREIPAVKASMNPDLTMSSGGGGQTGTKVAESVTLVGALTAKEPELGSNSAAVPLGIVKSAEASQQKQTEEGEMPVAKGPEDVRSKGAPNNLDTGAGEDPKGRDPANVAIPSGCPVAAAGPKGNNDDNGGNIEKEKKGDSADEDVALKSR